MYRIRIFGKFIIWLVKQLLHIPLKLLAQLHVFINNWKNECREDFSLACMYYMLTTLASILGGLAFILIIHPDDMTRETLSNSLANSFFFATGLFIFVILLASYDKFIEEYERTFTKLKE